MQISVCISLIAKQLEKFEEDLISTDIHSRRDIFAYSLIREGGILHLLKGVRSAPGFKSFL
jgi:hypothetical protein